MNKITAMIVEKVDLLNYIQQVLEVKQKGNNWVAVCPFHDDHKPSLAISPTKKIFKCFACGVGGNVLDFAMKWTKCDWKTAVQKLNSQFALNLPFKTELKPRNPKLEAQKELLIDAQKWFHLLLQNQASKQPDLQAFLQKRRISLEMIENWKLGFVEPKWNLLAFLKSKDHKQADILNSGLFVVTPQNQIYPFFQNRLLFAVYNSDKELVGFVGRKLDEQNEKEMKYLSFPTTALFRKNELLFNFEHATEGRKRHVYLVEGILDAIRIQIQNQPALALMGTNLSSKQRELLTTHFEEVIIWLDNDQAGWEATLKVATHLATTKLRLKIVQSDEQGDPDRWILTHPNKSLPEGISLLNWLFAQKITWTVANKQKYQQIMKDFWTQSDLDSQEKHRAMIKKIYGSNWLETLNNYQDKEVEPFPFQPRLSNHFNLEESALWLLFFFAPDIYQIFKDKGWKFSDPTLQKQLYLIGKWYNMKEATKSPVTLLQFLDQQLEFNPSKGNILALLQENKAWIKDIDNRFINDLFNKFAHQQEEANQPALINLSFQEISQLWKEKKVKRQKHEYISTNWKNPFGMIETNTSAPTQKS